MEKNGQGKQYHDIIQLHVFVVKVGSLVDRH